MPGSPFFHTQRRSSSCALGRRSTEHNEPWQPSSKLLIGLNGDSEPQLSLLIDFSGTWRR
jgi:hypothetical protein